jgi:hypothetical protein
MKKFVLVVVTLFCLSACSKNISVKSTNLDGISVITPNSGIPAQVKYQDGYEENIPDDYIMLFINGSIIKHEGIFVENDIPFIPIKTICKNIFEETSFNVDGKKYTIEFEKNKIEIYENEKGIMVNGKSYSLENSPKTINNTLFMGMNDISKILKLEVSYYDNSNEKDVHIIKNIPQIMISKYPKSAKEISKDEAVEILKSQIKKAFEKKFGEFVPLNEAPAGKVYEIEDKDRLRYLITNLEIKSENDRFYVFNIMHDFLVDKFTKEVYVYYNGLPATINKFNPKSENALSFPG